MKVHDIGALSDFTSGAARAVRLEDRELVVVRIEDDVYVLDDRCSHEAFWLSDGEVDADTREIECARHGAMFDLVTGEPRSLPATKPVVRYDVAVRDGRVEVTW
ncbi:MAG TPA: non-heme iron oxygenase ferredoxin subunit [Acidimicrobiales bacterium]|nr:non-heme iron oxygenase ferredoxin subunit [Acidimicrobiales bacterium]